MLFKLCAMPGKCNFQRSWLGHDDYRHWIAPDPGSMNRTKCRPCVKTFDVSSMGESALKSHMKSAKHSGNMKTAAGSSMNYVTPCLSDRSLPAGSVPAAPAQSSDLTSACKAHELVTDAEILWTLKVITSHYSYS